MLARFAPRGDRFNVPRFMWRELRNAMEDERKGIPYAPYLMFMIERVTSYIFEKDGFHTIYKIEKTQGAGASRAVRCSPSVVDVSKSSPSQEKEDGEVWEVNQGYFHHMHLCSEDRISGPVGEP